MACPYFYPVSPSGNGSPMLPLGDRWEGLCHAAPGPPLPCDAALLTLCNMGYARGQCPRFPSGDGPDAVRFTVKGSSNGAVSLYHVVERDHHPYAHGPLTYSPTAEPAGETLLRQARAYAECYLRRTGSI
jgi:hypothetical protein